MFYHLYNEDREYLNYLLSRDDYDSGLSGLYFDFCTLRKENYENVENWFLNHEEFKTLSTFGLVFNFGGGRHYLNEYIEKLTPKLEIKRSERRSYNERHYL